MKAMSCALMLMAIVAFVLVGCSDTANPLVAPNGGVVSSDGSQTALAKGAAVHSITGNGNAWYLGKMSAITINAHQYDDGSVKGEYNGVNAAENPKGHFHGDVVALAVYEIYTFSNGVSGRTAVFCWRVEMPEFAKGWYVVSLVVDNGEGKKATAADWVGPGVGPYDTATLLEPQEIVDMAQEYFVPIDVGNVVVR